ncbi:MAG: hypothetical protein WCL04_06400 [Verrucomicrobiota bacterium]
MLTEDGLAALLSRIERAAVERRELLDLVAERSRDSEVDFEARKKAEAEVESLRDRLAGNATREDAWAKRAREAEKKIDLYVAALNDHRRALRSKGVRARAMPALPPSFDDDNVTDVPF